LSRRNTAVSYFFIADEAFPLQENTTEDFSGRYRKGSLERTFNNRVRRARRVVKNVVGITSSVFRLLRRPVLLQPEKAELTSITITHLHTFMRKITHSADLHAPPGMLDCEEGGKLDQGSWRNLDDGI
jgi:hypothetical protein